MAFIPESELILNADGSVYHLGMLPHQLAGLVLTVGDPERVPLISRHFDEVELVINRREFVIHTGYYRGQRITVLSTGMGTDNIDIVMNELDALVNVDLASRQVREDIRKLLIIRIGTSGAMREDVPLGAHLASAGAFGLDTLMQSYHLWQEETEESWCRELQQHMQLGYQPYYAPASEKLLHTIGHDMLQGTTVTCAGFYGPQGRAVRLKPRHDRFAHQLSDFERPGLRLTNFEMETAGYYSLGRLLGHEVLSVNAIVANRITQQFAPNAAAVVDELIVKVLDRLAGLGEE